MQAEKVDKNPLVLVLFALLSYTRIFTIQDVYWDDNCWLFGIYLTDNLKDFLATGFFDARREALGIFLYFFLLPHKLTDFAHPLWNSLLLTIQVAAPVVLYLLVKNLMRSERLIAFLCGVSLVILPLDHTLPYLSGVNYRIGLLLSLLSFYLTERAFSQGKPSWAHLGGAFVVSAAAEYIFIEAVLALEPARLMMMIHLHRRLGLSRAGEVKRAMLFWAPFLIACIPLVLMKLMWQPYGLYATLYDSSFKFLLQGKEYLRIIDFLALSEWRMLIPYARYTQAISVLLALAGAAFSFLYIGHQFSHVAQQPRTTQTTNPDNRVSFLLWLGGCIILFQFLLFGFVGRPAKLGSDSTHAALMAMGYALLSGALAGLLYHKIRESRSSHLTFRTLVATFVGLGIFYNNLNLEMFSYGTRFQNQFWQAFVQRFPGLPETADFLIDAEPLSRPHYYATADLDNAYDLEFNLNLLYARSSGPKLPRHYRVYPIEELLSDLQQVNGDFSRLVTIERPTHYGRDTLDPKNFIVVLYRNGELLVNREILKKYPKILYRVWADKDSPSLPPTGTYPLRYKTLAPD